ncbi:MAG: DUF5103 domain-containing protein [Muribaculaceae bacterium]|nr:DUF5103 domain-containing protein [Muribaculaceae bacterium]
MKLRFLLLLFGLLPAVGAWGQSTAQTRVTVFDTGVRSLKVAPASNMYLPPVLVLGGDDRLIVNFDYLDYDVHYLRYSLLHCDAQWTPSQLMESEYVDGFNYADIDDYAQSEGTFTHYYNYTFALPNDDMRFTRSGNYVLRVYEQDDPDHVLFQTRFMVVEPRVTVLTEVTTRTDETYNDAHQQLAINLRYRPGVIADPYGELTTVVMQNTRTDNAVVLRHPMSAGIGTVTYEHQPELIFEAGNEYRRFETVNIHSLNMGVAAIDYVKPFYHAALYTDEPRRDVQYLYDQTQHGCFTIRNAEGSDSHTDADYLVTHFTLNTAGPLPGGNIFIEGEFTHGLPASETLMKYDASTGCYETDLLLKQGAYNYQYLWVPDGARVAQTAVIDGDKFQTVNRYTVLVYHRPSGGRYDQLVGYGLAKSIN